MTLPSAKEIDGRATPSGCYHSNNPSVWLFGIATTRTVQAWQISAQRSAVIPSRCGISSASAPSLTSFCPRACSSRQRPGTEIRNPLSRK